MLVILSYPCFADSSQLSQRPCQPQLPHCHHWWYSSVPTLGGSFLGHLVLTSSSTNGSSSTSTTLMALLHIIWLGRSFGASLINMGSTMTRPSVRLSNRLLFKSYSAMLLLAPEQFTSWMSRMLYVDNITQHLQWIFFAASLIIYTSSCYDGSWGFKTLPWDFLYPLGQWSFPMSDNIFSNTPTWSSATLQQLLWISSRTLWHQWTSSCRCYPVYQSLAGALYDVTYIVYFVQHVCLFMHVRCKLHLMVIKWIIWYVKGV